MLSMVKQQFRDLKFQKKIIGISVIISLIPIALLGVFSYTRMRSLLIEREETAIQETLHQEALQLDHKLNSYLSTMNLITWLHGLDHRELPGRAILSVFCYRKGQDIVFKVMDNGCGMSDEKCLEILTKESRGYGVKNVHQRVQLYYGAGYGLTFHSTRGMGTYVLLRIGREPGEAPSALREESGNS